MPDITLYSARTCPFAQRTRLLLEKDLAFELIEIGLRNTPEWFHRVSPYGKSPGAKPVICVKPDR